MSSILKVYVMQSSLNINRPFTYYCPIDLCKYIRVIVEFNHRQMMGLVTEVEFTQKDRDELQQELGFEIKEVLEIVDDAPILSQELFDLATWLSKTTVSPFISCLNTMMPKAFKVTRKKQKVKMLTIVLKSDLDPSLLTPRQKAVFDLIEDKMPYSQARSLSPAIISKLLEKGYISKVEIEDHPQIEQNENKSAFKELTPQQDDVYKQFLSSKHNINLLFGATGSGKTEVYLHLAKYYLARKKQVLILVPEISLTPQMIKRVKERFDNVAVYHSYLNDNKRYQQYIRILKGEVDIVVGTRSAVFLPFSDLGLIIIDEEHDHSFKQDNTPTYNARSVAFKRASYFGARVLLASATPSLESYAHALKGDYGLFKLPNRINNMPPSISIIDLKEEMKDGGSYIISKELENELTKVLSANKQAIILLNRRGYTPIMRCAECMSVMMCEDCETALTYHKDANILKCNLCGKTYAVPTQCPNCGSKKLIAYGLGTKKVVETLEGIFPDIKIGRMDADSTNVKNGHEIILTDFGKHRYDILVGTQMIAKGLDFPDVTLVGILNADSGLLRTSFNSTETTFDLLMQAAGRSGRAESEGKVIIQAYNTDHYVIKAVEKQDYNYFYNVEMNYRFKANYPPYSHWATMVISDSNIKRLLKSVAYLEKRTDGLKERRYKPFRLNKAKGKERYRFTFSSKDLADLLSLLLKITKDYTDQRNMSSIKIDVDPLYME